VGGRTKRKKKAPAPRRYETVTEQRPGLVAHHRNESRSTELKNIKTQNTVPNPKMGLERASRLAKTTLGGGRVPGNKFPIFSGGDQNPPKKRVDPTGNQSGGEPEVYWAVEIERNDLYSRRVKPLVGQPKKARKNKQKSSCPGGQTLGSRV